MGTVYIGAEWRYPTGGGFSTARDPFHDLILHLEFLTASDSAAELLRIADDTEDETLGRATAVSSHAKTARAFLEQSQTGPETARFVSAYYAVLNLSKIIVLFSPLHSRLRVNRYHGASYDPTRTPASLADDQLSLKTSGALPLLYEVLTGEAIPQSLTIGMRDVYCLISDVASEWSMATGGTSWLADFGFRSSSAGDGERLQVEVHSPFADPLQLRQLPSLRAVEPVEGKPNHYASVRTSPMDEIGGLFDQVLDRRLLYYPHGYPARAAIGNLAGLHVVEEIPLLLAFYHLSSVARYNPEFLDALRGSRYWPVAAALTSHGLYKFLLLTWCHVRRMMVVISRA